MGLRKEGKLDVVLGDAGWDISDLGVFIGGGNV